MMYSSTSTFIHVRGKCFNYHVVTTHPVIRKLPLSHLYVDSKVFHKQILLSFPAVAKWDW